MPFGIQTKGLIVGMILGGIIVPRVVAMVSQRSGAK